jgi:hypothetical protein
LARLKDDAFFAPGAERQNFSVSSLSPADACEGVDADNLVEPMETTVPPEPMPKPHAGVERRPSLDRKRVAGEAPPRFDNRRVVKPFGRMAIP